MFVAVMATIISIILLILAGIVLLILELLILPGLVAGIVGGILLIAGIWYSFHEYGSTTGFITAFATLALTLLSLYLTFKYNIWRRFSLEKANDSKISRVDEMNINPGDTGKSLSAIRPMGMGMFNHKKVEVQSMGEMIDANSSIEVIEVLPNKLIVKKI
jgi:membrane-bound ClpP family serine protease